MQEMGGSVDKEEILKLRDQVAQDAQQLVLSGNGDEAKQLVTVFDLVQTGKASPELLRRAYELVQLLPDGDDKLDYLMSLLDELDTRLTVSADKSPDEDGFSVVENQ